MKVLNDRDKRGFGPAVMVEHPGIKDVNGRSLYSIYLHFDSRTTAGKTVGTQVYAGVTKLGEMGIKYDCPTAISNPSECIPHTHFELRWFSDWTHPILNNLYCRQCDSRNWAISMTEWVDPTKAKPLQLSSVYRFWGGDKKCHFFTAKVDERNSVITNLSDVWDYERSAFTALARYVPGTAPVHRYWSNVTGCHFYTIHPDEKALTDINPEWVYEGVEYYAYRTSSGGSDTTPLYRFYSPVYKSHFYTVSIEERDHVIDNDTNWTYEGIGYWVSKGTPTPARVGASGTKPLHCGSMSQKECNVQIASTILSND